MKKILVLAVAVILGLIPDMYAASGYHSCGGYRHYCPPPHRVYHRHHNRHYFVNPYGYLDYHYIPYAYERIGTTVVEPVVTEVTPAPEVTIVNNANGYANSTVSVPYSQNNQQMNVTVPQNQNTGTVQSNRQQVQIPGHYEEHITNDGRKTQVWIPAQTIIKQ